MFPFTEQQESQSLSQNVKLGLQFRYQNGQIQVNHNRFLGYTKDEEGHLIIEPTEAEVVRRIYREYLSGKSLQQIGAGLEADGILTGAKKKKWCPESVKLILMNEKYMGDALLQKTCTTDFIEKTRVKNTGIVPQYYVEGSHEAIIPKDIYMQVQEEIIRRANLHSGQSRKKRVYSSKYALSSIVYCSQCGEIYRRIAWNNRGKHSIVWRCCTRVENGPKACDADTIQEEELKEATVKAINMAVRCSSTMLEILQENIAAALGSDTESKVEDINAALVEKQKLLIKTAQNKAGYDELADEIDRLREEKQQLLVDKAESEGYKQRISELGNLLQEMDTELTEYDEAMVRRYIEKITVFPERFRVEFKAGIELDIER